MSQIDPGTPTWLRARNDRTAFRLLLDHGPLSRAALSDLSGMSKPTATQMLKRLERVGLIAPVGEASGGRGPNAITYGVRTDTITGVAVSILEHAMHAVVVDAVDGEHPIVEVVRPLSQRSPQADVRAASSAACVAAGIPEESVSRVVIGVQAAVFVDGDELSFTDTLPGWPARGARRQIEDALDLAVTIDNDVNLATMAERSSGVAQDVDAFVLVWLGSGLGVGVDVDGTVLRGAHGGAGEIGYLSAPRTASALDPEAADMTDLVGAPGVVHIVGGAPGDDFTSALARLAGDDAALAALAARIVLVVDPLLAVLDPALVVLGGPTAGVGGETLANLVAERIDQVARPQLHVRTSGTGDQPVLLGARQQLVEQIRRELEDQISSSTEPQHRSVAP